LTPSAAGWPAGAGLDFLIPRVTAEADVAGRTVTGSAPPAAPVTVRAFAADPDYFGNQQYERPFSTLRGRADAQGRYSVTCTAPDCGVRYGLTAARVGTTDFTLEWLDAPLIGVGVTVGDALVKATAGTPVTWAPLDAGGRPGMARAGLVRPALSGGLPEWSTDLSELYPEPLRPEDRLRITAGGAVADVQVPQLTWAVSPARDDVRGQGPPLHAFLALITARPADREPPFALATGVTDLAGRFEARYTGFDVRAGDDAELYLLRPGHFLWWTEKGVQDIEVVPTASPSPTAAPTPSPPRLILPYAEAGAPGP
jgi:hypothetical protein